MNYNTKFSSALDKLNSKIAELNIKISKDSTNEELKHMLELLLKDRDIFYKGTLEQMELLIKKYGESK